MPLLSEGEQSCLLYILDHTIGYADPQSPTGRKEMDVISLTQFERGITSGNYLLDLGTGLSRGTIRKAIDGLLEKDLVVVRYQCLHCLWKQAPDADPPKPSAKTKAPACPRCNKTLDRAFGLANIRPSHVIELLNLYDKQKRRFQWDRDAKRPIFEHPSDEAERKQKNDDLADEADRLRDLLWYPDLVDQILAQAEGHLKAGRKVSLQRRITNFYRPVYDLQEKYPIGELVRYALAQTIKKGIADKPDNRTWHHYTAAICKNNMNLYTGQKAATGTNAAMTIASSLETHEKAINELLKRAAELNDRGEHAAARELLYSILSQARLVAGLFDNGMEEADNSLREAFKQGVDYFRGIKPLSYYPQDYFREWTWPRS